MSVYLYRAVSLETRYDEFTDELIHWPGCSIGRQTGYLSRSSAVDAGRASGVAYEVLRSEPVVFVETEAVKNAREIAEIDDKIAVLQERLATLGVVS